MCPKNIYIVNNCDGMFAEPGGCYTLGRIFPVQGRTLEQSVEEYVRIQVGLQQMEPLLSPTSEHGASEGGGGGGSVEQKMVEQLQAFQHAQTLDKGEGHFLLLINLSHITFL